MTAKKTATMAALAAVLLVAPVAGAYAATMSMPMMVAGTKTGVITATALKPMIGKWTKADLSSLAKAKSITVFDTKSLYSTADQKMVASAESSDRTNLKKLHEAISGDASLKGWFAANKIDVNRVVGVSDKAGSVAIYLY